MGTKGDVNFDWTASFHLYLSQPGDTAKSAVDRERLYAFPAILNLFDGLPLTPTSILNSPPWYLVLHGYFSGSNSAAVVMKSSVPHRVGQVTQRVGSSTSATTLPFGSTLATLLLPKHATQKWPSSSWQ